MNRLTRAVVPAMLLALVGSAANAQPEPSLDLRAEEAAEALDAMAPTNAGLVYLKLIVNFDTKLSEAALYYTGEEIDPESMTMAPDEADLMLAENQSALEKYIWASRLPEYDLGLQYNDGWAMILPHLGKLRSVARVLVADARRQAELGELDKAADRVEAVYNIAWQIRDDKTLISSLVSIAIVNLANQTVADLLEADQLTGPGRDNLVAAAERFQTADPFRILDCIEMEYTVSLGWLAKMPADTKPSDWLTGFVTGDRAKAVLARFDAAGRASMLRDAERMGEYYRRATQAWDDPDAVEKIAALGAVAEAGAFGEMGTLFLASLDRAKSSELRIRAGIDETLALLRAYGPTAGEHQNATNPADEQ